MAWQWQYGWFRFNSQRGKAFGHEEDKRLKCLLQLPLRSIPILLLFHQNWPIPLPYKAISKKLEADLFDNTNAGYSTLERLDTPPQLLKFNSFTASMNS